MCNNARSHGFGERMPRPGGQLPQTRRLMPQSKSRDVWLALSRVTGGPLPDFGEGFAKTEASERVKRHFAPFAGGGMLKKKKEENA